jgi:hypothetical protein
MHAMDDRTWNGLMNAARETHVAMMTEGGLVPAPALFALLDGRLIGYVRLRPVYRGQDAAVGIAEMSYLAAAAQADEVVATWETIDVAIACEHEPLFPGPALNVARATPEHHLVQRFPYTERRLRGGRFRKRDIGVEPVWTSTPPVTVNGPLEPAIEALLQQCWKPFESAEPNLVDQTDAWLTAQGYTVTLFA